MTGPTDHVSQAKGMRSGPSLRAVAVAGAFVCALSIAVFTGRMLRLRTTARAAGEPQTNPVVKSDQIDRGEIVFQIHCAKCHGPEGHGDPEAMAAQKPPPRDFAMRPWRFEVTPDSIHRVTIEGIPGTAMPSHRAALNDRELDAVVAHVYRLAKQDPTSAERLSPLYAAMTEAGFFIDRSPRDAPDIKLVDAAGQTRSLADERGHVILLNFWGITCEHCLAAMPKLQSLSDRWESRGLRVLNVCADAESIEEAQQLVARVSPGTHVWEDETGLANAQFDVQVMPTLIIIDAAGKGIGRATGMKEWDSPAIESLVGLLLRDLPAISPTEDADAN
jgi:mono/diheme cytochrome c family protein